MAGSYKKEVYQSRPSAIVLCGLFIQIKKTTKLGRCPMSFAANSYKEEDYQARPLSNVICGRFILERRLSS